MKKTAKAPAPTLQSYPEPDRTRSGNKVAFNYYKSKADAETCAKAAVHNAAIREAQGYDFGYMSPGAITEAKDGMFEVVLP